MVAPDNQETSRSLAEAKFVPLDIPLKEWEGCKRAIRGVLSSRKEMTSIKEEMIPIKIEGNEFPWIGPEGNLSALEESGINFQIINCGS